MWCSNLYDMHIVCSDGILCVCACVLACTGDGRMRSPYQLFLLLLPLTFWTSVVEQTNKYATESIAEHGEEEWEGGRKWVPITVGELLQWIGMCIGMTLTGLNNTAQYWWSQSRGLVQFPNYGAAMGQTRWEQIKRYLHLADNKKRPPQKKSREYRLWHVLPMVQVLNNTSKMLWTLGQKVVIDERTIPSRHSKSPIRIYNPSKPYKFGYEVFSLCCATTYYCWHFIIYDKLPQKGLHSLVVMQLVHTLVQKGHVIFLDRGFTSPSLVHWLGEKGFGASGTVVKNRKGFPKDLQVGKKEEQGSTKARVSVTHKMMAVVWKDKKEVHFLSNCHKSLEGETSRQVGSERKTVACPQVAREYNEHKAGVDQFDKLCLSENMSTEREIVSFKWWVRLFWGLMDGALSNAFIIWKSFHPEKECTRMEFMLSMHEGLMENGLDVKPVEKPRKKVYSGQGSGRLDGVGHLVQKIPDKKRGQKCRYCRYKLKGTGKEPSRSLFWCRKCQVALCVDNCFEKFHLEEMPGLKVGA